MWAMQNPTKPLVFVVAREVTRPSLLEMELNFFFHQQHNLQNVEVLGLSTKADDALSSLLKEATTRPPGSWMVDELIMPGYKLTNRKRMKEKHEQWTKEMQQLHSYIAGHTDEPLLWLALAGIKEGQAEHFKLDYLAAMLPPVFHLPDMDVPLRNTKQVLAMANLEANTDPKGLNTPAGGEMTKTNPVYKVPDQLMEGVEGKTFHVNKSDVVDVVEEASKEVLRRTGGAGFPVLCETMSELELSNVKRGVERACSTALVYNGRSKERCSEAEVEEWLSKRRSGEERRQVPRPTSSWKQVR